MCSHSFAVAANVDFNNGEKEYTQEVKKIATNKNEVRRV